MFFDESIILKKKYLCPVCSLSTFDAPPVMSKTRGGISNGLERWDYYDIECSRCGFNFRVGIQ